ncbi:MAG: GNAT family N-acetyltransferase [Burkholderiales bacterium]|nr:GNAT family N-acetyltransferase [Burkholderiales bacterium]
MPAIAEPRLLDLPPRLVGERIVLRPYAPGDGELLFAALEEDRADLGRWMAWPATQHRTLDEAESYVRNLAGKWLTREAMILGIFSSDGQTLYGGTGFHGFDWQVPSLEMGWFLRKSARGQGIATEAIRLCCKLAFEHIGANRVWATIDVLNEPSWRAAERAGFTREAHLRGECRDHHGTLRDTFVYAMLAREWNSI